MRLNRPAQAALPFILTALAAVTFAAEPTAAQLEFFEAKIRPVFVKNCYECHSADAEKLKGGLRVDGRETLLTGGDSGPAIEPGDPDASYLVEAIGFQNVDLQMPPKSKLSDTEIADIKRWIRDGAAWPAEQPKTVATKKVFDLAERKASHWCWQPIRATPPPAVRNTQWVRDPIDQFVLAKLDAANLTPSPAADRRTWLRRVTFDLIGLPPTPDEVDAFERDQLPNAFETVVDRLLASPQFGERWGRHWLDLVRYAETYGHEFDFAIPEAWRYRDYVIRALNADVPYDQFVTEHIAGDLMPQPRVHPTAGTNESILGTGFWLLGEQVHAPVDVMLHQADRIDNQIDVMGKTFLGLTLGCARCHDHKFDAISTKDVYSLWGYMQSSRPQQAALDRHGETASAVEKLKAIWAQGDQLLASTKGSAEPTVATESDVFESFNKNNFEGWFATGFAFGDAPTRAGQWNSFSGKAEFAEPGIAHSGMLAKRLTGALRSTTFTIASDKIWLRLAGKNARVRVVIDGFRMDEFNALLFSGLILNVNQEQFQWQPIAGALSKYKGHRAYIELIDDGDGYLAVDEIVFGDNPPNRPQPTPAAAIAVAEPVASQLAGLATQLADFDAKLPTLDRALALADGDGIDQAVYVRGSHKNLGETAPRGFLEAIVGADQPAIPAASSSRLELASRIVDPKNPLTARVMANRVWHHLFGRGIVGSTDNFGVLGDKPTHPELLDHLADRLMREGWSTKRLIRAIALSNTYRMISTEDSQARQADPRNELLHHMRVRRLEGEIIRDSMLAISGRLDRTQFGPPVPVHLSEFMQGRGRPSGNGPADGNGRRSIYLEVRRNFLNPFMLAFDTPSPFATVGKRTVSNVPAQALALMNDPFVVGEARRWSQQLVKDGSPAATTRIDHMYRVAFGRPARAEEAAAADAFVTDQSQKYGLANTAILTDERPWTDLAHVLFNCKEFIFIE